MFVATEKEKSESESETESKGKRYTNGESDNKVKEKSNCKEKTKPAKLVTLPNAADSDADFDWTQDLNDSIYKEFKRTAGSKFQGNYFLHNGADPKVCIFLKCTSIIDSGTS